MTEKAKKIILYTVSLALAAVLLYFAFRGIDWKDFWITLGKCNWWWIIGGMIAAWLAIWLRGMRWQLLFVPLNKDVKTVECYDSYSIGYMVNMISIIVEVTIIIVCYLGQGVTVGFSTFLVKRLRHQKRISRNVGATGKRCPGDGAKDGQGAVGMALHQRIGRVKRDSRLAVARAGAEGNREQREYDYIERSCFHSVRLGYWSSRMTAVFEGTLSESVSGNVLPATMSRAFLALPRASE